MLEKFKYFIQNDQLFYGLIVILVGLTSFGLGRVSVGTEVASGTPAGLALVSATNSHTSSSSSVARQTSEATPLVASKSGTRYHLITCPGAKQIKEENKVFFDSRAEAEAAGYKPAANCPELP